MDLRGLKAYVSIEMNRQPEHMRKMYKDMLKLIKSETPRRPDYDPAFGWSCPECDYGIEPEDLYCSGCGQRLEWSDEE